MKLISLVGGYKHFEGTYCLHRIPEEKAICSSETQQPTRLHGIITQKTTFLTFTTMKTSNLISQNMAHIMLVEVTPALYFYFL